MRVKKKEIERERRNMIENEQVREKHKKGKHSLFIYSSMSIYYEPSLEIFL